MPETKLICVSCGVFRMELAALASRGKLACDIICLDSMLHMKPARLEQEVARALDAAHNGNCLLLYGDCHPRMHEMQGKEHTARVAGINCCEILLGHTVYRKLQQEKAFIFLPEWAQRWREVFTHELGFSKPGTAQAFMKEHCRRLVYLDTGVLPVPGATLEDIRTFFDMPIEVVPISLDTLLQGINGALQKFIGDDHRDEY